MGKGGCKALIPKSRTYYEIRISLGPSGLIPLGLLPAYAMLQYLVWNREWALPRLETLVQSFELILPLAIALVAAHIPVVEREEHLQELQATFPEPLWQTALIRTCLTLVMGVLTAGVGMLIFRLGFGEYSLTSTVLPAVAPTLYLTGMSLLVSRLAGSYWAGAGASLGYWFLEVVSRGNYTGSLFLFARSWPPGEVDYAQNRWWLAVIGTLLLLGQVWISDRRWGR